jgi:hypothetical protein
VRQTPQMQEIGESVPEPPLGDPSDGTGVGHDTTNPAEDIGTWHRAVAVAANNSAWELLDGRDLDDDEVAELLGRAHTAAYHWARAAGRGPENSARADWLRSRAYAVANEPGLALRFAERCAATVERHGLVDFDRAYAHEARARALAAAGRFDEAAAELALAGAVPIADDEDRSLFQDDLRDGPWFGLVV